MRIKFINTEPRPAVMYMNSHDWRRVFSFDEFLFSFSLIQLKCHKLRGFLFAFQLRENEARRWHFRTQRFYSWLSFEYLPTALSVFFPSFNLARGNSIGTSKNAALLKCALTTKDYKKQKLWSVKNEVWINNLICAWSLSGFTIKHVLQAGRDSE